MNTRVSTRQPSRRRASEANSSQGKVVLNVDAYVETGVSHSSIRMQAPSIMSASSISLTNRAVGQQTMAANILIDVEAIEDDVQLLSSPGQFPQSRNHSRRNRPVTVVLDEDSDVQAVPSGMSVMEPAVRMTANNSNQLNHPPKRAIINCEAYEDVEFGHKSKRNCVVNTAEPRNATPKEPVFTCAICWGPLIEETSTICGHIFCQGCIKAAIQAQKKCPTCRKTLTVKNIHRVYLPTTN